MNLTVRKGGSIFGITKYEFLNARDGDGSRRFVTEVDVHTWAQNNGARYVTQEDLFYKEKRVLGPGLYFKTLKQAGDFIKKRVDEIKGYYENKKELQ